MTSVVAAPDAVAADAHARAGASDAPTRPRRHRRWQRIISPLALLLLWEAAARAGLLSPDKLPAPSTVLATGWRLATDGTLGVHLLNSLSRAAIGLFIGGVLALVLGAAAGLLRLGDDAIDPPVQMARMLPHLALVPLLIIWVGIGESMKITLVALGAFFPLYFNTYAGIRDIDERLVEAARTCGLGSWARIRHVVLPGALPALFLGLRLAIGAAHVCVERMARDIAVSTHLLAGAGTAVLHQASATVGPRDDPADELLTGRTAGVRVCLDAGLDGDGTLSLRQRWAAAHAVGPVLAAAFANSPLCAGRPTGWRSNRQALRLRSGSAPLAEPAGDPRAAWAAWVLDAPVTGAGLTARTFRQWTRAAPAARPTAADLRRHLDTLRPPVAAHGHLEIDLADRQPGDGWRVPVAVTAVLIEDDRAVDEVLAATAGLGGSTAGRWATAARHGLGDPALATAARACFLAAYAALARYGARRAVRDAVADFTERYVLRGRCPADDVLDRAATRP